MGLYEDVKLFAEMDLAARKVLDGGSFTKLDGEVELSVGEGLQPYDPSADAAAVEFEPELGEVWALRAQADQHLTCGDAGWSLQDAQEEAAEREASDAGWQESRYLIA